MKFNNINLIMVVFLILISLVFFVGCSEKSSEQQTISNTGETDDKTANFTDSLENLVSLNIPVNRIVALNSNTAEILAAIGANDTVVGLADPTFTGRPWLLNYFSNPEKVGSWSSPNCEKLVDINPDVVIAYSHSEPYMTIINPEDLPILYLDVDDIEETISAIRIMGELTGKTEKAEELAEFYESVSDTVNQRIEKITENQYPTVYMEMYSDYTAVAPGSASDNLIRSSGGKNILTESTADYPIVSKEWVIQQNPDIIIRAVNTALDPNVDIKAVYDSIIEREGFDSLDAVKNNRIYILTGEMLYGPRSFSGVLAMAKIMHPEVFEDIYPEDSLNEYATRFLPEAVEGGARMYPSI